MSALLQMRTLPLGIALFGCAPCKRCAVTSSTCAALVDHSNSSTPWVPATAPATVAKLRISQTQCSHSRNLKAASGFTFARASNQRCRTSGSATKSTIGPQRCARHRADDAGGALSSGACKDDTESETADAADTSQAATVEGDRNRE